MRPVLAGKTTGAQNILSRLVSSSLPITALSQTLQKISLQCALLARQCTACSSATNEGGEGVMGSSLPQQAAGMAGPQNCKCYQVFRSVYSTRNSDNSVMNSSAPLEGEAKVRE